MVQRPTPRLRNLVLILGDQLDHGSCVFDDFDFERDAFWMAEVAWEAEYVWSHKLRIAVFFSAMRHFRDWLRKRYGTVHYHQLTEDPGEDRGGSLAEVLAEDVKRLRPEKLILVRPGDYRVMEAIKAQAEELELGLEIREDRHFYSSPEGFREFAAGRKSLVLETFYRQLRKEHDVLLHQSGKPAGGEWNFDSQNRETFGREGPPEHKAPRIFAPDAISQEVIELVKKRFAKHPGSLEDFSLPITRDDALAFLREFIEQRLPLFGKYQDAMWMGGHFLYHSRLSALLNLKLLNPREVVNKACEAYSSGQAPINSVEGFVRQILGWREFMRGIYWLEMPGYLDRNVLGHDQHLPSFYWHGETDMSCARDAMTNVLRHGYAHHIQRLMVLGLFAQIYGANPREFHEWHVAMYLDAVDWVSAPNTIGMSQWADGGLVGTKPYCASGNYISKMSNYCKNCRFNPKHATGDKACPFTVFYWDFLARHHEQFSNNPRMNFQVKNVAKKKEKGELAPILEKAKEYREAMG